MSDADIKGFFNHVDHQQLMDLLAIRVSDAKLLRLIQRFLKAGVMIDGHFKDTDEGVPRGAVLSLLLANVYLHYVLDQWFEREVLPRLAGAATLVRYADDFICTFEFERDARRFQEVLKKRLGRYSLELAEDKTKDWLRHNLTQPIEEVWQTLNSKLRGHYQYYGINDNWPSLIKYQEAAKRMAYRWICRRSQTGRMNLRDYGRYLDRNPLAGPRRLTDGSYSQGTYAGGSDASVDK